MGSRARTQADIDAATMAIKVQTVGSGYIQLPPQKRFESVIVQPPTMAHLDHPDQFHGGHQGGGRHAGSHQGGYTGAHRGGHQANGGYQGGQVSTCFCFFFHRWL
ncbi:hypothetical protein COO60DRAFT_644620 [Scenedesmus sp. NREL 46B-D3]|nr:hypothetical protein COO60DRAFT_644620 [Scenedesmus sp. NREL 46B-D3]